MTLTASESATASPSGSRCRADGEPVPDPRRRAGLGRASPGKSPPAVAIVSHELWRLAFRRRRGHPLADHQLNGVELRHRRRDAGRLRVSRVRHGRVDAVDLSPRGPRTAPTTTLRRSAAWRRGRAGARPASTSSASRGDWRRSAGRVSPRARWSIGIESLRESQFGRMLLPLGAADGGRRLRAAHRLRQRRDHVAAARVAPSARDFHSSRDWRRRAADVIRQLVAGRPSSAFSAPAADCRRASRARPPEGLRARRHPRLHEVAINLPTALFIGAVLVLVTLRGRPRAGGWWRLA